MKKRKKDIFNILFSLLLGGFIFWWAYRGTDTDELFRILQNDVKYSFIVISVLLGILANLFRAWRWQMLLNTLEVDKRVTTTNTFFSVLIGYFANFLVPRAGEVVRCGVISKYHHIPLTKVIGSMITERAFDILITGLLVLSVIVVSFQNFQQISANFVINKPSANIFMFGAVVFFAILLIGILFHKRIRKSALWQRVVGMLRNVYEGFMASMRIPNKFMFVVHTLSIWGCYFLMFYIPTMAFDFSAEFSVSASFFVFVVSNLGTLVPVQGGIGAWHYMCIVGMMLFGISRTDAGAFAIIVHGAQMISYLVGGFVAMVGLQLVNRTSHESNE